MPITAKIILNSINPMGRELISLELRYNRFIHSEFLTYGSIVRNAASSRAIPADKYRTAVEEDPAMPVWWGKNEPGMQSHEELPESAIHAVRDDWLWARDMMVAIHKRNQGRGLHKQLLNRLLEVWSYITVIATANLEAWEHLLFERTHEDAQPEFRALAFAIKDAIEASTPTPLAEGEWHLPYIREEDRVVDDVQDDPNVLPQVSAARCARVSYLTQDGVRSLFADIALFGKLIPADNDPRPGHFSPLSHVAQAMNSEERSGQFVGFRQLRKAYARENERMMLRRPQKVQAKEEKEPNAQ